MTYEEYHSELERLVRTITAFNYGPDTRMIRAFLAVMLEDEDAR